MTLTLPHTSTTVWPPRPLRPPAVRTSEPADPAAVTQPLSTAADMMTDKRADTAADSMGRARTVGRIWAYLGIVLGAVVSVAANVAHSYVRPPDISPDTPAALAWTPETGAVLGATFWPIALLITTEIMIRTSWPPGRAWLLLRFVGLLPVAGVAGVVSYLHLHGLLQHYHEAPLTCLIAPLSVDGLMVMASSALLASNTATTAAHDRTAVTAPGKTTDDGAAAGHGGTADTQPPVRAVDRVTGPNADSPAIAPDGLCEACRTRPATTAWSRPPAGQPLQLCDHCIPGPHQHAPSPATDPDVVTGEEGDTTPLGAAGRTARPRERQTSTAAAALRLLGQEPALTTADIARRLGVSSRTVRRHLAAHRTSPASSGPASSSASSGPGQQSATDI